MRRLARPADGREARAWAEIIVLDEIACNGVSAELITHAAAIRAREAAA